MNKPNGFIKKLLDILFPPRLKCQSCNREAAVNECGLCEKCARELVVLTETSTPGNIEFVDRAFSALLYNDVSRRAVIDLKFHNAAYKKEFLAYYMRIPSCIEVDCIVPVPLHPNRLRRRGYNQSTLLAGELAEKSGIPVREDLLWRVKDTPMQSKATKSMRMKNVINAFRASDDCKGLSILLVDDVRTTGSTLRECAKQLKRKGAKAVYALTACCAEEYANSTAAAANAQPAGQ